MKRKGRAVPLLLALLGLFAVAWLLFGDAWIPGGRSAQETEQPGGSPASGPALPPTGLETGGTRPAAARANFDNTGQALPGWAEGVSGIVVDTAGRPVGRAGIQLFADPPAARASGDRPDLVALATTVSAADGTFVIGPCPADGHARLRAEAEGYAPSVQRVRGRGARVELMLDRAGQLEIRCLDVGGAAVAGATVIHEAAQVVTALATDAEGYARFQAVPTGTGSLLIVKSGYGSVRERDLAVAPGETETRTFVLPHGVEIRGTVLSALTQRPEADVRISVAYPQMPTQADTADGMTDAQGRFQVTAWAGGNEQVLLRALKPGFAEGRVYRSALSGGELVIHLYPPGAALSGRVLSANRQPAANVRVTFAGMQQAWQADMPEASSEEDGSFHIAVPSFGRPGSGFTLIAVSDAGGLGLQQVRLPRSGAQATGPVEIILGGAGSLSGRVRDAGGSPVSGAQVSLTPDGGDLQGGGARDEAAWQLRSAAGSGEFCTLTAVSGLDGRYLIQGIPALAYRLTASLGLDRFTLPEPLKIVAGERTEKDIALGEGGTIEGFVLDGEEKPIAGAYVMASLRRGSNPTGAWQESPAARSQSDGRFVLRGIVNERYNLSAFAAGYGSVQRQDFTRGDRDVRVQLRARGWIEGLVLHEGRPPGGTFTVLARRARPGDASLQENPRAPDPQALSFQGADGRFVIKGLRAGDYQVVAWTPEGLVTLVAATTTVVDGQASRSVRLELAQGAAVAGVVRDDETGQGLPGVWVHARGLSQGAEDRPPLQGQGQTDAHGNYEIKGLETGTYEVAAYLGGSPVAAQIDLQIGAQRHLNLIRERPGSIRFRVLDREGKPLPGAATQIRTSTDLWVGPDVAAMKREGLIGDGFDPPTLLNTGADGSVVRYHVPPGMLTVWASKPGYRAGTKPQQVQVTSGSRTEVELTLEKDD